MLSRLSVWTEYLNIMNVELDLHLHTSASDGKLSPGELVGFVARKGLKLFSITDHDTTLSLAEAKIAAQQFDDLELIPGIELSTSSSGEEVHILGYHINPLDQTLQSVLHNFRLGRELAIRQTVDKLREAHVILEWERVLEIAGEGAIGRPHVAHALLEKGYIKHFAEAFDKYIGRGGIGYVDRPKITPAQACDLITSAGGVPVLAHPKYLESPATIVEFLLPCGLSGIEVFYGDNSSQEIDMSLEISRQYDLLPCGGSDYHAKGSVGEKLPGEIGPPIWVAQELLKRSQQIKQIVWE